MYFTIRGSTQPTILLPVFVDSLAINIILVLPTAILRSLLVLFMNHCNLILHCYVSLYSQIGIETFFLPVRGGLTSGHMQAFSFRRVDLNRDSMYGRLINWGLPLGLLSICRLRTRHLEYRFFKFSSVPLKLVSSAFSTPTWKGVTTWLIQWSLECDIRMFIYGFILISLSSQSMFTAKFSSLFVIRDRDPLERNGSFI